MKRKKHNIDIQFTADTEGKDNEHPLRAAAGWAALVALAAFILFMAALLTGAACAPFLGKCALATFTVALALFLADVIRDPGHSSQDNVTNSVS